jgi:hypothetical protein
MTRKTVSVREQALRKVRVTYVKWANALLDLHAVKMAQIFVSQTRWAWVGLESSYN